MTEYKPSFEGKARKFMRPLVFSSASVIFAAVVLGWMVHAGVFFQTGSQWFQSCWTEQNAKRKPATAEESINWAKCEKVTLRAVFGAGFVPAGNPVTTPETKALADACPRNWYDIPIGGFKYLAVRLIEDTGGPTLIEQFTPPDAMIERAFQSKWPDCQSVVKAHGFPKIIFRDGDWEFEFPCKPCEADDKARKATPASR